MSTLKVSAVKEGLQAEALGIRNGDLIVSYNGISIKNTSELYRLMNKKSAPNKKAAILIYREGNKIKLNSTLLP